MIQKSLSPVATSRIFSVGGNWIRVVYLIFARTGTMSLVWYFTTRAVCCGKAPIEASNSKVVIEAAVFIELLSFPWHRNWDRDSHGQVATILPRHRSERSTLASASCRDCYWSRSSKSGDRHRG